MSCHLMRRDAFATFACFAFAALPCAVGCSSSATPDEPDADAIAAPDGEGAATSTGNSGGSTSVSKAGPTMMDGAMGVPEGAGGQKGLDGSMGVAEETGASQHSGRDAAANMTGGADAATSGPAVGGAGGATGPADGGSGAADSSADDPLNFSARCTSNQTWSSGTNQNMRPGEACPTCHANFYLAGTLYPTGHEPDDCDGVDGLTTGATVTVTDSVNNQFILYPNAVGNFYTSRTVVPPFVATVTANGRERSMITPQTIMSCNSCHTQDGLNGAPGRITVPF
jgi:hypothetical protein